MAMNKAEKAAVDELRCRAALTLPPFEKPARVNIREELAEQQSARLFVGWCMNDHSKVVSEGCSNGVNHSRDNPEKTTTQGEGVFYRTRLEALRALRWALTERVMRELAEVDREIAEETGEVV